MILKNSIEQELKILDVAKDIQENRKTTLLCSIRKTGNVTLETSFYLRKLKLAVVRHLLYCNRETYKIMKQTLNNAYSHEIRIISGVRYPVERIISQQWQTIKFVFQHNECCIPSTLDENYCINDDTLSDNVKYYYIDIADWFKAQIEKMFDIDIFQYKFDKEKGYSIIKKDNISIFIYRLDKLSSLEKEIGQFVGDSSFILKNANIGNKKNYRFAYRQYLEQVKVKKQFFNNLVNSIGMTNFYTDEECKKYRNKWSDRLV